MLHAELEQIVREAELGFVLADVLVKVDRRDGEEIWVLIHVEVQAQPDALASRTDVCLSLPHFRPVSSARRESGSFGG